MNNIKLESDKSKNLKKIHKDLLSLESIVDKWVSDPTTLRKKDEFLRLHEKGKL